MKTHLSHKNLAGAALGLLLTTGPSVLAAPVLFDLNTDRGGSYVESTVSDFQDLGIQENILGASVMNAYIANGSMLNHTNEATGITVYTTNTISTYVGSATPNNVLREYSYSGTTILVSGLDGNLEDGSCALYLAGVGDKAGQGTTFTFDGVEQATSALNPQSTDATNFVVRYEFEKVAGVDTLEFSTSAKFNGFAITSLAAPGPDVTTTISPAAGATYITNLPTIAVEVTDGEKVVDSSSFTMALVSDGITNDVSSEVVVGPSTGGVTSFSYTPLTMLENGTEYTVLYSVAGTGGTPIAYTSTFTTAPDLHMATTPFNGQQYVATNAEISISFTNVAVSLSDLYVSSEMFVNAVDVSDDVVITYPTNGVMKFAYAHSGLDFATTYDVQLSVARSDGHTNEVSFSFESALDESVYLIAPGIRNGGFELVDGAAGETAIITDWSRIDNWDDNGLGAKTEAIANPTEGTRALVTGNSGSVGSQTYNITETAIQNGDIFEFKWTIPGRNNGMYAGLAYSDGGAITIASNSLVYVSGGSTPTEYSGSYLFDATKDANAIGKNVALVFMDDGIGGGAVYVDEARLLYGNIAVQSVSPAADATNVAPTSQIEVIIAEAASQVDTNTISLVVDGTDVTADSAINDTPSGITITYTPAYRLGVGTHYASITANGTPEGTASQSWTFSVEPTGTYLINSDLRNGSFELINGVEGDTTQVSDWSQIDDWNDDSANAAKTEASGIATHGSRYLVTGLASETYNMTTTPIANTARYEYSFALAGRPNGVTAALAYDNGGAIVIVSNSMTYVNSGTAPFLVSGGHTFTETTDPDAIGKPIGVVFIDDGTGGGAVQIDDVRLYTDLTQPTESPVIETFSIDGTTIHLSYTAENIGTYSLQRTENLQYGPWTTVMSNMPPSDLTTTLPTNDGASQEFFRVISE